MSESEKKKVAPSPGKKRNQEGHRVKVVRKWNLSREISQRRLSRLFLPSGGIFSGYFSFRIVHCHFSMCTGSCVFILGPHSLLFV